MTNPRAGRIEVLCGQALFLAAVADVGIRELYHRLWVEVRLMVFIFVAWLAWSLIMLALNRRAAKDGRPSAALRFGFIVAGAGVIAVLAPNSWRDAGPLRWLGLLAILLGVTWLAAPVARSALWNESWKRCCVALTAAVSLFVASQTVIGRWSAPHYEWLPGATPASTDQSRVITVILLMDELNASSAPALVKVLGNAGLRTQVQSVVPAGPHTAQAIPGMFTGHTLKDAKACGSTSMCSMDGAIDFSKVTVTRPNVDFVGFFHPYCAIQGLRYCRRSVYAFPLTDWQRWKCLWSRQSKAMDRQELLACERLYIRSWVDLKEDVLKSLWQAPAWTHGGTIYAHLPMPHPPGRTPGAGLAQHYRENLDEVAVVLAEAARKAQQAAPGHVRIVVVSDHPLRQSMWCETIFPYPQEGCMIEPSLEEESVPVIAADSDNHFGSLQDLHTNLQVFRWIATGSGAVNNLAQTR